MNKKYISDYQMEDYLIVHQSTTTELKIDSDTAQGIACYFDSYYKLSKDRYTLMYKDSIVSLDPSHIISRDVTNVPEQIGCDSQYAVVIRSSRSYDIYGFDNSNFLNGIYIGIGFCREEYSHVVRKIIIKDCVVNNDGLQSKVFNDPQNEIIEKVIEDNVESSPVIPIDTPEIYNDIIIEDIKEVDYPVIPRSPINSPVRKPPMKSPRKSPAKRKESPKKQTLIQSKINFNLMKLDELKKYARDHNIDIKGLTKKQDIVDKLSK
jgi:hypothetical protein